MGDVGIFVGFFFVFTDAVFHRSVKVDSIVGKQENDHVK
jgi:hypothetical protein